MKNDNMIRKIWGVTLWTLIILQIAVIILSWLVNSAGGATPVMRSLLSGEGLRWFFGHFTDNLASTPLVWLLLCTIAWGAMQGSGLPEALLQRLRGQRLPFRSRVALWVVGIETVVIVIVMLLLTAVPHALLLSSEGHLFPSSFSESLIPVICFYLTLSGSVYALLSGKAKGTDGLYSLLASAFRYVAPWYVIFIFLVQLASSIIFIFSV